MADAKRKASRRQPEASSPEPTASGAEGALDRLFGLTAAGSGVGTELRAGLATFLTMAYIMFVNPAILEKAGMDHGAMFVATCLAAAAGFNAYFTFTVVPKLGGNWQLVLGLGFLSGVLFFALSLSPLRAWLIDAIPVSLKLGIAAGIGFFLALIALQNAGIVADDPVTLVRLGDLSKPQAWLAAAGFLLISGLAVRKIPGAIILGVLAVTVAAVALGLEPWHGIFAAPPSLAPTFPKMDLAGAFQLSLITIVLTLLLVTMLDTAGTLIGVARQARLLDKEGRLPRLRQALLTDSGAAMLGAALGTSTNASYIESAAGVEDGGRTGLTAIFVALFFLLALFLAPLAQTVPLYHGTRAPVRRGSWPRWSNAGDAAVNVPRIQPLSRRSPLAIRAQPLSAASGQHGYRSPQGIAASRRQCPQYLHYLARGGHRCRRRVRHRFPGRHRCGRRPLGTWNELRLVRERHQRGHNSLARGMDLRPVLACRAAAKGRPRSG